MQHKTSIRQYIPYIPVMLCTYCTCTACIVKPRQAIKVFSINNDFFFLLFGLFTGEGNSNGRNQSKQRSGWIVTWLQKTERGAQTESDATEGSIRQVPHVRPSQKDLAQSGSHTSFHHRKGLSRWTLFIRLDLFIVFLNPPFLFLTNYYNWHFKSGIWIAPCYDMYVWLRVFPWTVAVVTKHNGAFIIHVWLCIMALHPLL